MASNLKSEKRIKKKLSRPSSDINHRKKFKVDSKIKADKKGLPPLHNPYFNFLRAFRIRYSGEPQGRSFVQKAGLFWGKLSVKQRALFKPENLTKGVSALSILNQLANWAMQQESDIDKLSKDGDIGNVESCCPKKRKACARKKPSCPRRKKRRSCKKKKKSCRRKRRSCKPKRRSCRPKKKVCRRKPKCRPKRRC